MDFSEGISQHAEQAGRAIGAAYMGMIGMGVPEETAERLAVRSIEVLVSGLQGLANQVMLDRLRALVEGER